MTKQAKTHEKKPRGRPPVDSEPVNVRFPRRELEALDSWIVKKANSVPSRAQAIRQIVAGVTGGGAR